MGLRRVVGSLLLLLMLAATASAAAPARSPEAAAERLRQYHVIQGVPLATGGLHLALKESLTRAELATILVRAFGREEDLPPTITTSPYPDVPVGEWYARHVAAVQRLAAEKGLALGTEEGNFEPLRPVSRAEALVLTMKLLGERATGSGPRWYEPWIDLALRLEMVTKDEAVSLNAGAPQPITRGEAFLYLDRILDLPLLADQRALYDVVLDKTPPIVTMAWDPKPETVQIQDRLMGTVADDRGIAKVIANGVPIPVGANGEFLSDLIPFALGKNQLELRVTDLAGNETVRHWEVTRICCYAARLEHGIRQRLRAGERVAIDLKLYDEKEQLLPPAPYRVVTEMGTVQDGFFTAGTKAGIGGVEVWTMNLEQAFNIEILPGPPAGLVRAQVKAGEETYLQAVDQWSNPLLGGTWRAQSNGITIAPDGRFRATVPGRYFVVVNQGVDYTFAVDVLP